VTEPGIVRMLGSWSNHQELPGSLDNTSKGDAQ
jgi:hypothetical protein